MPVMGRWEMGTQRQRGIMLAGLRPRGRGSLALLKQIEIPHGVFGASLTATRTVEAMIELSRQRDRPRRGRREPKAFAPRMDLRSRSITKQAALGQPSAVVLRPVTTTLKYPKVWLECRVGGIIDRQPLIHARQRHWRAPIRERVA